MEQVHGLPVRPDACSELSSALHLLIEKLKATQYRYLCSSLVVGDELATRRSIDYINNGRPTEGKRLKGWPNMWAKL